MGGIACIATRIKIVFIASDDASVMILLSMANY